ncbi:amidohydrolase family protein [Ruegeria sp. Ofav3-42]|uniref:amidohydrolase family protein n=1 Tax=Ruegeria sp. Ofav3-42 TaxID=2917759 RepID=UPI001EF5B049|nr:amidohydrolase family protein [Ruegeria sp. Ofav3-42]MCG7521424.1 amidohydrolase family protein [Ruegeria sp. Ofav3-42]
MSRTDAQIPICAGPDPVPKAPRFTMPPLACDCHAHVFGPNAQFPMVPDRLYTPPEAPLGAYKHLLATLGFQRAVIVQPSIYGTDNRATLQAAETDLSRYRAVVVIDSSTSEAQLQRMHDQGARGVRANLLFSGEKAMTEVRTIADRIAPLGWHLQVLLDISTFPDPYAYFSTLPVQTVFDHMGHFPVAKGIATEGFQALLGLMHEGKAWTKLSGAYRITGQAVPPYEDVTPIAKALIAANPDQVVYGTDWPHPHIPVAMPNDGDLVDHLADWVLDAAALKAILTDNPARLYGF